MDQMEQLVRIRLAQRERDKMKDYIGRHPELIEAINKAHEEYESKVNDSINRYSGQVLTGETMKEFKEQMVNPLIAYYKENLSINLLIDTAGIGYSKNAETFEKELHERFKVQIEELDKSAKEELGISLQTQEVNDNVMQILEYARMNDVFVARLTDIAKEQDIEEAMKDEIMYKVTKEIIPTREEYLEHLERGERYLRNTINNLGNMFSSFNSVDEGLGELIGAVFSNLNIYADIFADKSKAQSLEKADKIYGAS